MTAFKRSAMFLVSASLMACGPVRTSPQIPELPIGEHKLTLGMSLKEAEALYPKARMKSPGSRVDLFTISTPPKSLAGGALTYIGSGIFLDGKLAFLSLGLSWIGASHKNVLGQKNLDFLQKELREAVEAQYGVATQGPAQAVMGLTQCQRSVWAGEHLEAALLLPVHTSGTDDELIGMVSLTRKSDAQSDMELRGVLRSMRKPFEE